MSKDKYSLNIAILTQESGDEPRSTQQQAKTLYNRSIQLLIKSLEEQGQHVTIIPFLRYRINPDGTLIGPKYVRSQDSKGFALFTRTDEEIIIDPKHVNIVLKRTWGDARDEGLRFYNHFADMGVQTFNTPEAIKLSHSKIELFSLFQLLELPIPKTIVIKNIERVTEELEEARQKFGRYIMLKGEVGTQADNICLVDQDSLEAKQNISNFLAKYKEKQMQTGQNSPKGLVLQEYIPTDTDIKKSNYTPRRSRVGD